MTSKTTDWGDLKVLAVLHREGSLAGAARALGVNHATISRRVAHLEENVGHRLVRRLARSTPLTDKGREIAEIALTMEHEAQRIERIAHATQGTLTGRVRLTAPPVLVSEIIVPALAGLRAENPDLQIVLSSNPHIASLDSGEADLAVRMVEPQGQQNIVRRIGSISYALYASPQVAKQNPDNWQFIAFDETLGHVPQQKWLKSFAANRPFSLLAGDFYSQSRAAEAGLGVALLPCVMAEQNSNLVRLGDAQSDTQPEPRPVWLVIHTDLKHAPAVRAVTDLLVTSIGKR